MTELKAKLTGTAQVCCIHHVPKNQYERLIYNSATELPSECICCGNVFAYPISAFGRIDPPILCNKCDPMRKAVNGGRR